MKKLFYIVIILLAASVVLYLVCRQHEEEPLPPDIEEVDTMEVLVHQIQECSRLYTAEVEVHKLITHVDETRYRGSILSKQIDVAVPMSQRRIAIPVDAKIKAYIDFSEFSEADVVRDGDKVEIFLPEPKITLTSSKVRNEDIKKYSKVFAADFTDEELTDYNRQGRKDIIEAIPKYGLLENAQEGAANVLIPLLEQLGYKQENITVTFRKEFSVADILRMVILD